MHARRFFRARCLPIWCFAKALVSRFSPNIGGPWWWLASGKPGRDHMTVPPLLSLPFPRAMLQRATRRWTETTLSRGSSSAGRMRALHDLGDARRRAAEAAVTAEDGDPLAFPTGARVSSARPREAKPTALDSQQFPRTSPRPSTQPGQLAVLYADRALVVANKPSGMVCQGGTGEEQGMDATHAGTSLLYVPPLHCLRLTPASSCTQRTPPSCPLPPLLCPPAGQGVLHLL
jgi:hypothetical protein